jgi:hypothetical protein
MFKELLAQLQNDIIKLTIPCSQSSMLRRSWPRRSWPTAGKPEPAQHFGAEEPRGSKSAETKIPVPVPPAAGHGGLSTHSHLPEATMRRHPKSNSF